MQPTDETNKLALESYCLFLVVKLMAAKRNQVANCIQPFTADSTNCGSTFPETGVGLIVSEDDEETKHEGVSRPHDFQSFQ
jgi:hypothetical protein